MYPKKSSKGKVIFASIIFPLIFVLIIINVGLRNSDATEEIGALGKATNITSEEEKSALLILESLETGAIVDVSRIVQKDKNDKQAYGIRTKEGDTLLAYMSVNKLSTVMLDGTVLYTDGKVSRKYTDLVLTNRNATKFIAASEDVVKKVLKSPSTAKFPAAYKWAAGMKKDKIITQSYVDSQNSFGATIRSEFQVTFKKDGSVTSLIFDGEELIKK